MLPPNCGHSVNPISKLHNQKRKMLQTAMVFNLALAATKNSSGLEELRAWIQVDALISRCDILC